MSKISVTTIAGLTSGGDANKVKIESGDTLVVQSNALIGSTGAVGNANANELELTNPAGSGTVGMTMNVNSGSADTGNIYWRSNAANNNIQIVGDPVSNYLAFATSGAEKVRIDSNGRVGIGTSSPDFKAEIVGGTNDGLHIKDAESATVFGGLFTQSANLALVARSNHALTFGTNDAERIRITSGGNVGIGTLTPATTLHVNGSAMLDGITVIGRNQTGYDSGGAEVLIDANSGTPPMIWHVGGSEVARINSNGRVGIGTSAPPYTLSLQTSSSTGLNIRHLASGNGYGYIIRTTGSTTNDLIVSSEFNGVATDRLRILSAGGLVVGGTTVDSYSSVAATHTMYGLAGTGAYALGLTQNTTSAGGGRVLGLRNVTDFNNTSNEVINYNGNTTQRFLVVSNGNVTNTNNSYGAVSDQKLKEQIADASSQWDDIKALTVRKYKMKDEVLAEGDSNAAWKLGVIAQELETAGMTGLVDERIDRDEDGNDAGTTTKQVKYSVLYMKAVKALQEAMTRIETLETQRADLEARLTALENA